MKKREKRIKAVFNGTKGEFSIALRQTGKAIRKAKRLLGVRRISR
ncbi:MAG: hypothetical protein E7K14_14500 [Bacillota bacterium]|nr:hypothetical protein [Bacillota bacterium]